MASPLNTRIGHQPAPAWIAGVLWLAWAILCCGEQQSKAEVARTSQESEDAFAGYPATANKPDDGQAATQFDLSSDNSPDVLELNVDGLVQQLERRLLASLDPDLHRELAYVQRVCTLTDDERDALQSRVMRWLQAAARFHAIASSQTRPRSGRPTAIPNPRALVESVFVKVIPEELSALQAESYRAEQIKRVNNCKRAGVLAAVAAMDERLKLTGRQRGELFDVLMTGWEPDWIPPYETLIFNDPPRSTIPSELIAPLITPAQQTMWLLALNGGSQDAADWDLSDAIETKSKLFDLNLSLDVETTALACGLSEEQVQRLLLAGRGDIGGFVERAKSAFERMQAARDDPHQFHQARISLQEVIFTNPLGEGSLFQKVRKRTIDPDQVAMYEQEQVDRARYRYEAKLAQIVATLDGSLRLRDQQRHELEAFLIEETKLPNRFGRYDYFALLFQAAELPEHKIKPFFDDFQWTVIQGQFAEAKKMEPALRRTQYFP